MATKDTVELTPPHAPKEESIKVFGSIESELKEGLIKLRRDHDKHEKEYFQATKDLSDDELTSFTADNFEEVRVGVSAYGIHLFGKLKIPALGDSGPAYVHFRAFSSGTDDPPKFHSFHTEETEKAGGDKTFRAIFTKDDALEWFDS